ncbi:tRNA (adenosine(37)-N6)-dimethylallyltransferase MiaA [Patescibacteria group bacterium]
MDITSTIKDFLPTAKKPLIVILGGTASGKTALSIKIAKEFDGEVISTDSRQVYKYMDIGTAKVTTEEMEGIPHYMIDVVSPDEEFSLADFVQKAKDHIADIQKRGKIPILAGGTGLYTRAICDNFDIPRVPPNPQLRKELEKLETDQLHQTLKDLDPDAAERIHPNNRRYVIRAIELAKSNKQTPNNGEPEYDVLKFGIEWDRDLLYKRINERAAIQIKNGLIEETQSLIDKGFDPKLPSMSSLGYPEMLKFINKELPLDEALTLLQQNTRHYAKRQITWFKREPNVIWLQGAELNKL